MSSAAACCCISSMPRAEDIAGAYRIVRAELKAYGEDLAKKKEIVALSKCDALDEATLAAKAAELKAAARKKPLLLSAVSGRSMKEALVALAREIERSVARNAAPTRWWSVAPGSREGTGSRGHERLRALWPAAVTLLHRPSNDRG